MAHYSNSSDGDTLDCQCSDCILGEEACPIYWVQNEYNSKQLTDGKENIAGELLNELVDQETGCKMKPFLDSYRDQHG